MVTMSTLYIRRENEYYIDAYLTVWVLDEITAGYIKYTLLSEIKLCDVYKIFR